MTESLSLSGLDGSQYALAIHTSSPDLGLALSNFAGDSRCQTWNLERALSTHLHLHLNEFIQPQTWSDLAFLAVAKGPGGFTGTRIGMVAARTLAQQLNIPLFAISSLAAIAWDHFKQFRSSEDLAVQMRAQRGELFTAIYSVSENSGLITAQPDAVMSAADWEQVLHTWKRPPRLIQAEDHLGATVTSLLELAWIDWQRGDRPDWSAALPFYGQHPVTT